MHARITPEPRVLSTSEAPRGADRLRLRLVLRPLASEVTQHLRVPQGAACRPPASQSGGLEPPYLGDEAGLPHPLHALADALVELVARHTQADLPGVLDDVTRRRQ